MKRAFCLTDKAEEAEGPLGLLLFPSSFLSCKKYFILNFSIENGETTEKIGFSGCLFFWNCKNLIDSKKCIFATLIFT